MLTFFLPDSSPARKNANANIGKLKGSGWQLELLGDLLVL